MERIELLDEVIIRSLCKKNYKYLGIFEEDTTK